MGAVNKVGASIGGLLWFLAGLFLINLTWSWSLTLSTLIEDSLFLALFWSGYAVMAILTVFMPPFILILNAYKEEGIE